MIEMTWAQVCARRLARHGLLTPAPAGLLAAQVGVICGAHAQVLSATEIAIGLRVAGATHAAVRDALWVERSLVKTYGPRGTVHLISAQELALWCGALAAASAGPGRFAAGVRLSDDQTDIVVGAIAAALADTDLTVEELDAAVVARCGAWAGDLVMPAFQGLWPRWRQAISAAAHRGVLCFGQNRGRAVTYTSPRRWLPEMAPMAAEAASREALRRYLFAYGPATPQQFAQWIGAPRAWASALFTALAAELELVVVEGSHAWVVSGDTLAPEVAAEGVHLLPYFDGYVVGCHPRERLYPGVAAERALSRGQAGTVPVLLVDGAVAGIWSQRRAGRRLMLTVEPFAPLTDAQRRELDARAAQIGAIVGAEAQLALGAVTTGKHL